MPRKNLYGEEIWEPWECHCTAARGARGLDASDLAARDKKTETIDDVTFTSWRCRKCGLGGAVIKYMHRGELAPGEYAHGGGI